MYRIAISGKGGSGKTTIAGLIIKAMLEQGIKPVLAVDADPAGCLTHSLDAHPEITLGDIREMTREAGDLPKSQFVEMSVQNAVWEGEGFDVISIGRPEGPGCYCFVNNLLRDSIERLSKSYRAVVIDCEAGMEHLSRRTTGKVDLLILVSDLSLRGILAVAEMVKIAEELDNEPEVTKLLLNATRPGKFPDSVIVQLKELGFRDYSIIPFDPIIAELEARGENILELQVESVAYQAIRELTIPPTPPLRKGGNQGDSLSPFFKGGIKGGL
jgi:CO dehydrogenase maturation factor